MISCSSSISQEPKAITYQLNKEGKKIISSKTVEIYELKEKNGTLTKDFKRDSYQIVMDEFGKPAFKKAISCMNCEDEKISNSTEGLKIIKHGDTTITISTEINDTTWIEIKSNNELIIGYSPSMKTAMIYSEYAYNDNNDETSCRIDQISIQSYSRLKLLNYNSLLDTIRPTHSSVFEQSYEYLETN